MTPPPPPSVEMLRPAIFTPESKTLEELLSEFQQRRVHMAIVVDEYGGVSGIVTIEDLLEEIVGEIQDEFDDAEPPVVALGDDEYLVEAGVGVDQLNDLMNVSVEADGFDTLGGLVYQQQGRITEHGGRRGVRRPSNRGRVHDRPSPEATQGNEAARQGQRSTVVTTRRDVIAYENRGRAGRVLYGDALT